SLAFLGLLSSTDGDERRFGGDSFLHRSWDSCRPPGNDRIYAVPWFLDIRVLYYRRDLLQEAGVSEGMLENWSGFSAACRRLREFHLRKNQSPYPLSVSSQ